MKKLYEANDGTIFKDEDECLQYERMQRYANKALFLLGDFNGKFIPLESILSGEEDLENAFFIICKSYEGFLQLCDLYYEFGCVAPKDWENMNDTETPYCWLWDEYKGSWEPLHYILEKANRLKNIFKNLVEKG